MADSSAENYQAELAFAKEVVDEAGKIARSYYKTDFDTKTKSDHTPVTIADETINQMAIAMVKERWPQDGVLGEEVSWQVEPKRRLWVFDPIDGTERFARGLPDFAVSLACVVDGQPVVAVTANPIERELVWATKGGGSFRNGQALQVSQCLLSEAWLAFPSNDLRIAESPIYGPLRERVHDVINVHSPVIKGMAIAGGTIDGAIWHRTMHPWDVAGVKLTVEEAGGKFSNFAYQPQRFDQALPGGMVMSNGVIHDDLLRIIKTAQN